jgi:hypothetical protein
MAPRQYQSREHNNNDNNFFELATFILLLYHFHQEQRGLDASVSLQLIKHRIFAQAKHLVQS